MKRGLAESGLTHSPVPFVALSHESIKHHRPASLSDGMQDSRVPCCYASVFFKNQHWVAKRVKVLNQE